MSGGAKTYIDQVLPENIWDALLGANSPSGANPFATMSDLGGGATLYTADDTIGPGRIATLTDTLTFQRADAGYFQLAGNGYVINTGLNGAYFEWDHNAGNFSTVSTTHTRVGFKTMRSGDFGEFMSGGGQIYFNTNAYFNWYTNNTGTFAGQLSSSGNWGFGGAASSSKVTNNGLGNTSLTLNHLWRRLDLVQLMQLNDGGQLTVGNGSPNAFSLLELISTDKAFLIMRMTSAQASLITPVNGMGLYVTDVGGVFISSGFWKYENGGWAPW